VEEHAVAYEALRGRVTAVVVDADPAALDAVSPACPEWRVHDVLAHLVGVTDDVVNGRLDGVATNAWTAKQVDARRDTPTAELLAEWDTQGPAFEKIMAGVPAEIAGQALFDSFTHEHDIRHALGRPGARDSDALALAWSWILAARSGAGRDSLLFVTEAGSEAYGAGNTVATVRTTRFELLRAISGRRSMSEINAYDWDPKAQPLVLLGSEIFTIRANPLNE
jgi:uncharacterized protein (TIGR03083 family)